MKKLPRTFFQTKEYLRLGEDILQLIIARYFKKTAILVSEKDG